MCCVYMSRFVDVMCVWLLLIVCWCVLFACCCCRPVCGTEIPDLPPVRERKEGRKREVTHWHDLKVSSLGERVDAHRTMHCCHAECLCSSLPVALLCSALRVLSGTAKRGGEERCSRGRVKRPAGSNGTTTEKRQPGKDAMHSSLPSLLSPSPLLACLLTPPVLLPLSISNSSCDF